MRAWKPGRRARLERELPEVRRSADQRDQRVDERRDELLDQSGELGADHDCYGELDQVPAHDEVLEAGHADQVPRHWRNIPGPPIWSPGLSDDRLKDLQLRRLPTRLAAGARLAASGGRLDSGISS